LYSSRVQRRRLGSGSGWEPEETVVVSTELIVSRPVERVSPGR
jgi:hypothetical protein